MSPVPEDERKDHEEENNVIENIEFPVITFPLETSDTDENDPDENDVPSGYQLLPQELGEEFQTTSDEEEDEDGLTPGTQQQSSSSVPVVPSLNESHVIWNQKVDQKNVIQMDNEQVAEIKAAMSGFQLPISNVPEWANQVSEDQWKEKLTAKLSSLQTYQDNS